MSVITEINKIERKIEDIEKLMKEFKEENYTELYVEMNAAYELHSLIEEELKKLKKIIKWREE